MRQISQYSKKVKRREQVSFEFVPAENKKNKVAQSALLALIKYRQTCKLDEQSTGGSKS